MRKTLFLAALCSSWLWADEGMWLYENFPKQQIQKKYGFQVSEDFLNHLRLSSVRLGASGSFVSPKGLIFTNHHVAAGCIQKVSTAEHNYMANGFYAASEQQELKCPDTEANVLVRTEDVTAQVNAGVRAAPGTAEANQQRRAAMARLEKECTGKSGHRCQVVTLYEGALYHLYEYNKYTDIRLVFCPEEIAAFFGGDPDNFTYPRYDLDITFLRAYENGRPANTPNYLRWSREGVKDGELVFVSGHPGSTDRFITQAQYEFMRDTSYPLNVRYLDSVVKVLHAFGALNAENHRIARDKLFSAENSYKVRFYELKGLRDPKLLAQKQKLEAELLARAKTKDARLAGEVEAARRQIAASYRSWAPFEKEHYTLERGPVFSDLFRIARNLVRLPAEKAKPNGQRLREYTDAALGSLELRLYSPAPIFDSVEIAVLANYFRFLQQELGATNSTVKTVLAGRAPEQAAEQYVRASKLKDVAERKRLAASVEAVNSSQDGMIRLARLLDEPALGVRRRFEDQVEAIQRSSAASLAQARFAILGAEAYPDATGTLRLSYGPVKGYKDDKGQAIAYATDFAGMYRHATGADPFRLPDSMLKAKGALSLKTPLNFVSTADIIGGNSGSPTINTKGEVVGIIFDGNIEGIPSRFVYTEVQGRAVHVASQGIIEALRRIYHANRLVDELAM